MEKKYRKAVRSFLIKDNKIVVIKYKTELNLGYYDIPGGKIEENETSEEASIREFYEETGLRIVKQRYRGNVVFEYPTRIFDMDIYEVTEFENSPKEFEENIAMWEDIDEVFSFDKKFSTIEIIKYIKLDNNFNLKILVDDNHKIISIQNM